MNKNFLLKGISTATVLSLVFLTASPVLAYTKDETVYGKLNSNGEKYSTIVTSHLKNTENSDILRDMAELLNIKNINGDESFETEESNILKWNSNGNDIYYQGETEKQLPIECNIKYELDGEEISAQDLAGKSGNVKITIEYKNLDEHIVKINGEDTTMYTPFVVATGTILDNTKAKNIKISNGKVVDNGTKTLALGITCPGLQDSLDLDEEDFEIPSKIEIEFEATDFEMNNIISYATPKLIEESDFSNLDKLDDLYSKVSTLSSSSSALVQGAKELQSGVDTYVEKDTQFGEAMDSLQSGVNQINSNYSEFDDGISKLNSSASKLEQGAGKVNDGVDAVSSGLENLQNGVVNGKEQATSALEKSSEALTGGIDQIIEGKDQEAETIKKSVIEAGNEALKQGLTSKVSSGAKETAGATLNAMLQNETLLEQFGLENLTEQQKTALVSALKTNMDTTKLESGIESAIDTATEQQKAGIDKINNNEKGVKAGLETLRAQATQNIASGIKSISSGFDSISSGVSQINDGTESLKEGTTELYTGTKTLTAGTSTLKANSKLLKNGISTLNESTATINNANKQLLSASQTIQSGVNTLTDGIERFDSEGIQEIANLVNGKVKNLQERIEALKDLANEYNSFAGIDESAEEGTVKFILMTDSIKKTND